MVKGDDAEARALLARIAAGEERAMAAFYEMFEGRVIRFVITRLNDSFEAADVLNEVMLEVWRGAGSFEGRSKVASWVLGIAHHKAMDRLRKPVQPVAEPDVELPDEDFVDGFDRLAGAEDAAHVRQCMQEMTAEKKAVMYLAFFEDLTYREIAAVESCPEGTVKTRMYHAKQAMLRCLKRLMGERP